MLVLAALSGCTDATSGQGGPDEPGGSDPPTGGGDPDPGTKPGVPMPLPNGTTYPREAFGTMCEGFSTSLEWFGSNERFDPPPHPGWEYPAADDGPYWTTLRIKGFECERFKLGAFERPVRFLVETASLDAGPEACARGGNITVSHMQMESLWINDTEVVDYLKEVYDLPVHYADIEAGPISGVQGEEYEWVMRHEDGAVSRFATPLGETGSSSTSHDRIFWWNDTTLGAFDYSEASGAFGRYTTGQASPPMALADWHTDHTGLGSIRGEAEIDVGLTMYQDFQCQEEVP